MGLARKSNDVSVFSWRFIAGCAAVAGIYLIITTLIFMGLEKWSFVDSLYFMVVSSSTIGYGDIAPQTKAGRAVNVFAILLSVFVIFLSFHIIIQYVVERQLYRLLAKTRRMTEDEAPKYQRLGVKVFLYLVWLGIWIVFFRFQEKMTWLQAAYFAVVTSSTVGYGRFTPKTTGGKWFAILFIFVGVIILATLAGSISELLIQTVHFRDEQTVLTDLREKAMNSEDGIDKTSFLARMLIETGKVNAADVSSILQQFDKLDKDMNGLLNENDFQTVRLDKTPTVELVTEHSEY